MPTPWPRMLSAPITLHWEGWSANTHELQRYGWSLSADQNIERGTMRIAIRHSKTGAIGMTDVRDWNYQAALDPFKGAYPRDLPIMSMEFLSGPRQTMIHMPFSAIRDEYSSFEPIDATPSMTTMEPRCLEDLVHFANHKTQRIILPEPTVDELMKKVLDLQEPSRQEHFLAEEKSAKMQPKFHAQILSFAA